MAAPEVAVAYVSIVPSLRGAPAELQRQLVGPVDSAGGEASEKFSTKLLKGLKVGAAAAAATAGALIAKGIGDAVDQANITSKLGAQLGATSKQAGQYGKVAGQLYSNAVSDSFEDAADAIKAVAQSGLLPPGATNKQIQSIATKASDVANTFGQDFGDVTTAVSQMIRTGLVKNASQGFDVLTKGFQNGANKADDLLDTFNEYGVQFKKLGLDGPKALGLISQALKGGARDSDLAADALKEFSIRAVDGSATTIQGFKGLGLSAKGMAEQIAKGGDSASKGLGTVLDKLRKVKDPVKQSQIAVDLFGTQAEDLGSALYKMDPKHAVKAIGDTGGAAKKLGNSLRSGPTYQLTKFKNTLTQDLVNFVGNKVIPFLTKFGKFINDNLVPPFQDHIVPAFKDAKRYLGDLFDVGVKVYDWMDKWLPIIAGVGTAVGLLALVLNLSAIGAGISSLALGVWGTVTGIATGIAGGFSAAMGILNAVMALNPFVLIVIALVALGVAFAVAWKKSATFRDVVTGAFHATVNGITSAWNWLYKNIFTPIGHFFTQTIPGWAKTLWHGVVSAWNSVGNGISSAWHAIKSHTITPIGSFFTKTIPGWATSLKNHVVDAFKAAGTGVKNAWNKIKGYATTPVKFIVDTVYNHGIRNVWNKVAGAFGASKLPAYKFATGGILPGYTPGRDVHLAALSGGEAVMRPEWTRAMGPAYVNQMNALARKGGVGAVQKAMGGGLPAFKNGGIFGWIGSAANAVAGAGSKAWNAIKKGASWLKETLGASARAGVKKVVNPLLSGIPGLSTGFGKMIKRIPEKMIDTIFGYADKADKKGASAQYSNPGGKGVERWRDLALKALAANGLSSSLINKVMKQIATESGGNPNAVNNWDSNAKAGHPSKGLMQTIDATFQHYKFPGHGNIFNGYDNLLAALNYAKHRYGKNLSALGQGHGYDSGGWLAPGATMAVNKSGKPEPIFSASQWQQIGTLAARGATTTGLQSGDELVLRTDVGTFSAVIQRGADKQIDSRIFSPAKRGRK